MIPNKIEMFMGYNNLALILEQERKHWLLKTDKRKQLQDKVTGDVFQGQIDNLGSDVIIESEKLPIKNDVVQSIKYMDDNVHRILNVDYAAFTHSTQVDGLMIARMTSILFPYDNGGKTVYKNYKLRLKNCEEVYIPFGSSLNSSDVFVAKWLKTSTPPRLMMLGNDDTFSIEYPIGFSNTTTNVVYYYPLTPTLQPLEITNVSSGVYETVSSVNDNGYIGYPLYWFTCDQSTILTKFTFTNNTDEFNHDILYIGNEGNSSLYYAKLYYGINGPSFSESSDLSNYSITVTCKNGLTFDGYDSDFDVALSDTITISSFDVTSTIDVKTSCDIGYVMTMSKINGWTKTSDTTYKLESLSIFHGNDPTVSTIPLLGFIDVHFDEEVKPNNSTTDIGYAGIRMSAANPTSDVYDRYPYSLNEWDGLPEWLNDNEDGVPQHMSIYAIHNTPSYIPDIPDSRQVAALLLDPGKPKTSDSEELTNDERGRIYLLSNDEAKYENNLKSDYRKPARTLGRICDVPTSVVQLSGISGIAPTSIVDTRYVRTEASYSTADKERLYNTLSDKWVKPTMLDIAGKQIIDYEDQDNDYVFNSVELLNKVDFKKYNDLRLYENLNSYVDPLNVELAAINTRGVGYVIDDIGVVVVGGFAFHYTVTEIDDQGGVTDLVVSADRTSEINLVNFNLEGDSGVTEAYGTSPLTGNGSGLKFKMIIREYDNIKLKREEIREGLFAFVKTLNGLYLYNFEINKIGTDAYKTGKWVNVALISEYDISNTNVENGLSVKDAELNAVIPSIRMLPCVVPDVSKSETSITTYATSSFVNIIDKKHIPYLITSPATQKESDLVEVDMCCFYCDGIKSDTVLRGMKTPAGIVNRLRTINELRHDSYIFYKFDNANDINNLKFTYGIIHRGFNNYLSTDKTTILPQNKLSVKTYVHANEGTTIVWDTPNVGPMMWTYNPTSHICERYVLDPDTRDLVVNRKDATWKNIKIRVPSGSSEISLVDNDDKLAYNILTNNPVQVNVVIEDGDPLYKQPDFVQLSDLQIGQLYSGISKEHQPIGNWNLVHPRIESYTLENLTTGRKFTPVKMRIIKGASLGEVTNITDDKGNIVNHKCMVINESSSGATSKVYNSETGKWVSI